jgi:hypothetical protein
MEEMTQIHQISKKKTSQIARFLLVAKNIEGFCFLSTFISSTSGCPWRSDTIRPCLPFFFSFTHSFPAGQCEAPVWNPGPKIEIPHSENQVLKVFRFRSWKPRVWKSRPQSWDPKSRKPCPENDILKFSRPQSWDPKSRKPCGFQDLDKRTLDWVSFPARAPLSPVSISSLCSSFSCRVLGFGSAVRDTDYNLLILFLGHKPMCKSRSAGSGPVGRTCTRASSQTWVLGPETKKKKKTVSVDDDSLGGREKKKKKKVLSVEVPKPLRTWVSGLRHTDARTDYISL